MIWLKKTKFNDIDSVMEELTGVKACDLLNPIRTKPDEIGNMDALADRLFDAVMTEEPITVVGDYDADGITGTAILYLLLTYFGLKPNIRLPHRMSEGYGLSPKIVEEIMGKQKGGIILMVDNGISANEAVKLAKDNGYTVLVLDHHLPPADGILPDADIIVDQHVDSLAESGCDEIGFREFCGAGLAYMLAKQMLGENQPELLHKMCALATVGTVADVVPLTGENRAIVQEGLEIINELHGTSGLNAIRKICFNPAQTVYSESIAFYIAPALNAPGRLYDDGARVSSATLAYDGNEEKAIQYAQKLKEINEYRKSVVKEQTELAENSLKDTTTAPLIVMEEGLHEGLIGIIAGSLTEKYRLPTIVLTKTSDGNWKGSGRSGAGVHLKERLDKGAETMLRYGGHGGAAGLAVSDEMKDQFYTKMKEIFADVEPVDLSTVEYDLEINADEVVNVYEELEKFQPFGCSCPQLTVRVNNCVLTPLKNGKVTFYMGKERNHVKYQCVDDFSIIAFSQAEKAKEFGEPQKLDVVGKISLNESIYGRTVQILAEDFRPSEEDSTNA